VNRAAVFADGFRARCNVTALSQLLKPLETIRTARFSHSLTGEKCSVDWNTTEFTYNSDDGYWYYNKILLTGEVTPALMTKITIGDDMVTEVEDLPEIRMIVYAESVQSKLFANADEAWAFFNAEK
jgi:hypothetical protein